MAVNAVFGSRVAIADSRAPARNPGWHVCRGKHAPDVPNAKRIALTFDDGPSVRYTPGIVSILRRHRIPATFFVVGRRLRSSRGRALVRTLVRDPLFTVASHSYNHENLANIAPGAAATEIERNDRALARAGAKARYFRFPYSSATCGLTALVRGRGMAVTGWNVDSADWCFGAGAGFCSKRRWSHLPGRYRRDMIGLVLERATSSGGGIVLLHDTYRHTADKLEALITALESAGFTFVALSDAKVFPLLNKEISGNVSAGRASQ